jgi:bifunctional ADP-heptose synthase (sugar kinase/adenylyltransferase)
VVGRDSVRKWGGKVVIIPETEGASTTNIVEKIIKIYGRP